VTAPALLRAREKAIQERSTRGILTETERFQGLPRAFGPVDAVAWTEALRRTSTAPVLRDVQATALEVLAHTPAPYGVLGMIGVGWGKTLLALLAGEVTGATRSVVIVPPSLRGAMASAIRQWRALWHFPSPRVLAYSDLSRTDAGNVLEDLQPDLLILDEAQSLRHFTAARTKRVFQYVSGAPLTRVICMSGTLTSKSILEYAHLSELALRDRSPLPLSSSTRDQWASVLDSGGEPDWLAVRSMAKTLDRMEALEGDMAQARRVCREAFRDHLRSTLGVVATDEVSVDVPLLLSTHRIPMAEAVREALQVLADTWTLPDGTEIVDGSSYHRAARSLALGFFYRWDWGPAGPDLEWLDARRTWAAVVRRVLQYHSRPGRDTPALVERAAREGTAGRDTLRAWAAWEEARPRWPKGPPVVAVWVSEEPLAWVSRWVRRVGAPALVWYHSRAVGEALRRMGLEVLGAGDAPPEAPARTLALSIPVFHPGHNLQAWTRNLVIEPPSSGATWDQLLGRTHRQGQTETVRASVLGGAWALHAPVTEAIARAEYIQETTGVSQRMAYAQWVDEEPNLTRW